MSTFQIDSIVIGDRVRKDMGDLKTLAESMKRHGLLHPVVVKTDRTLVAGHRRLEAARLNGWTEIAVTVVDVADLLAAERDENAERKDFTPTEAVAIGRLIEEQHLEKIAAQESMRKALGPKTTVKQLSQEPLGETRETAAKAVGMSGSKYYKAKAVVAAAEADPEKFGDVAEQMDATGNVSGAHQEMERRKGTANGKKARHPVHHKMHYPKPNREMERALPALDGICECLEALKPEELDASKTRGWAEALKKIASRINKVARRI